MNRYIQYMYSYPHKTSYRQMEVKNLREYLPVLKNGQNSLYFHIPFCQYKCGYCNLFSLAGQSFDKMEEYLQAMERQAGQISSVIPSVTFDELTIGGGTPLILDCGQLQRLFAMAEQHFHYDRSDGTTVVETSPNQTSREKLRILKEYHVNRLSIGVQSFQEKELQILHRFHTEKQARQALSDIKDIGFDCVNIDLIYGIPGQTIQTLEASLKEALSFEPEELFIYPLYVKKGTRLYREGMKQSDEMYQQYCFMRQYLTEHGYHYDSMRRFVRNTGQDITGQDIMGQDITGRNITGKKMSGEPAEAARLCGFGNTLSLGCGGRSYLGNLHICSRYAVQPSHCSRILEEYIRKKDYLLVDFGCELNRDEQRRRYIIRHILFDRGVLRSDYTKHFQGQAQEDYPVLKEWIEQGYAVMDEQYISLTEEGFGLSDYLGPQLISPAVRERMDEWTEEDG